MKSPPISHLRFVVAGFLALALAGRAQTPQPQAVPIAIPRIVDEVAANNPEIQFYEFEVAAAKSGVRAAAAINNPGVSLELGRKRVSDTRGSVVDDGTAWSVSVTQTFEWPGRIPLRKAIANRDVALAELGLAGFRQALVSRALTLAYTLYAAGAKASAVREVADRFAGLKETFLARDPAGVAPLLETRVIEATEVGLRRRVSETELALQTALIELNHLRGVSAATPLCVAPAALKFTEPPVDQALLAAALENNVDLRMRRVELEQQGYVVRLSRNEAYPSLEVSPFYTRESGGEREAVIGIGLSLPLPVSGRARSDTEAARARQRQAEVAVLVAQRELERAVLLAAHTLSTRLAETRRWSPDAVQRFREAAELADRHYRLGAVPLATYVEMQTAYLDAVESLLDTQREAMEAGLRVQLLTGLDFDAVHVSPQ